MAEKPQVSSYYFAVATDRNIVLKMGLQR